MFLTLDSENSGNTKKFRIGTTNKLIKKMFFLRSKKQKTEYYFENTFLPFLHKIEDCKLAAKVA